MSIKKLIILLGLSFNLCYAQQNNLIRNLQRRLVKEGVDSLLVKEYFSDPRFKVNDKLRETKRAYSKVNYFDKTRGFWQEETFQRDLDTLIAKKELFDKLEVKYSEKGISRFLVVSLSEMESNLGNEKATHSIFNAYVSEYLDERAKETRREWFYDLLKTSLKRENELCENCEVNDLFEIKGSWAGAFGPMQIMPDEYFSCFIDFNEDGKKNPLDLEDCIGNVATVLIGKGIKNTNERIRKALYRYNPAEGYAEAIIEHARILKEKYGQLGEK
jgi:membrane-bound lytic murein transglycosylase B